MSKMREYECVTGRNPTWNYQESSGISPVINAGYVQGNDGDDDPDRDDNITLWLIPERRHQADKNTVYDNEQPDEKTQHFQDGPHTLPVLLPVNVKYK